MFKHIIIVYKTEYIYILNTNRKQAAIAQFYKTNGAPSNIAAKTKVIKGRLYEKRNNDYFMVPHIVQPFK